MRKAKRNGYASGSRCGRSRLLQQMLSESLLLGITAGTAGLFIGHVGTRLLVSLSPAEIPIRLHRASDSLRVLGARVAASAYYHKGRSC